MTRKKNQEEKKIQILEALHRCIQKKPFDQTSIKEIAATAGVNHGLLHYYFKNKEDILLNYIEYVLTIHKTDFIIWFKSITSGMSDKTQLIKEVFNYVIKKITLNRELSAVFIEIWEIALYNPKVKLRLRQTYEEWIQIVSDVLSPFISDKNIKSHTSIAIVAFLEGIALFSIILDPKEFNFNQVLESFQSKIIELI